MTPTKEIILGILCKKNLCIDAHDFVSDWFDGYDLLDIISDCEKEFNCHINFDDKDEYSFETMEELIDWIISEIKKNNTLTHE